MRNTVRDCVPNERYTHVGKLSVKQLRLERKLTEKKAKISLVFAFRLPTLLGYEIEKRKALKH